MWTKCISRLFGKTFRSATAAFSAVLRSCRVIKPDLPSVFPKPKWCWMGLMVPRSGQSSSNWEKRLFMDLWRTKIPKREKFQYEGVKQFLCLVTFLYPKLQTVFNHNTALILSDMSLAHNSSSHSPHGLWCGEAGHGASDRVGNSVVAFYTTECAHSHDDLLSITGRRHKYRFIVIRVMFCSADALGVVSLWSSPTSLFCLKKHFMSLHLRKH